MKLVLILLALVGFAMTEDFYTTGDDNIDVDAFFADQPRAKQFLDCYMDRAPCPELADSYKKIFPEAIAQACKRCNSAQKHIFWKFLQGLKAKYAEEYQTFRQKYDPESKYFENLEKEISKY
ncbi:ejaculatory bulb-specific protein 3-like [Pararge aegeria]|uniref:ejaculatory bulb-specific protein 3-like n=1 Tax=Pararge aegeria TaxID=116150 RepID=UPI0019D25F69|nr:ejaculatory bulb-specific protein 3-like [Pararge aegeria]